MCFVLEKLLGERISICLFLERRTRYPLLHSCEIDKRWHIQRFEISFGGLVVCGIAWKRARTKDMFTLDIHILIEQGGTIEQWI